MPAGASSLWVNGYPMAYSERGSGAKVVFIGGVLTDYRIWHVALALWEPDLHVVAVSLRRFYPEKWLSQGADFTIRQQAQDMEEFLAVRGGPVFLVGWSYGCQVAHEVARARPDLVKKLVLVEAPLDAWMGPTPVATGTARRQHSDVTVRHFGDGDLERGMRYSFDLIGGPGAWAATPEAFREVPRDNAWTMVGVWREAPSQVTCAEFGLLRMPLLLVQGQQSTAPFRQDVADEARCLPHARWVTIPNAGHPSPITNPSEFRQVVTTFILE